MPNKIYVVSDTDAGVEVLVEAASKAQALKRFTDKFFAVRLANTMDVARLMRADAMCIVDDSQPELPIPPHIVTSSSGYSDDDDMLRPQQVFVDTAAM